MPFINGTGFTEDMSGKLLLPENSKFQSSLNEIDVCMKSILLEQLRETDTRDILGDILDVSIEGRDWLWDETRVFQVDELTTEEILDVYLLRKKINKQKNSDVTFPLCAYFQRDVETVFWGTGNRYRQWFFDVPVDENNWETGDMVYIVSKDKYLGKLCRIEEISSDKTYCYLSENGYMLTEQLTVGGKYTNVKFLFDDLRPTGDKAPGKFKAKSVTGKYDCVVLCDTKDEAQYIRDKFILRATDSKIWWKYYSPTIQNTENQLFTVFGIPNIERYPASKEKLKGEGYIYGLGFQVDFWGMLADTPLPDSFIESIRINLEVVGEDKITRILIKDFS